MIQRRELKLEKSRLYVNGVVVRDPLTLGIVNSFRNKAAAVTWARMNKWPLMDFTVGVDECKPESFAGPGYN